MTNFKVNDKVTVIDTKAYDGKFYEMTGVVRREAHGGYGDVGVIIDGVELNKNSAYGCYWFRPNKLMFTPSKSSTTNTPKSCDTNYGFSTAEISFLDDTSSRTYMYACYDATIYTGDLVVVKTGHHGFALAKVNNIYFNDAAKSKVQFEREIVAKVDTTAFKERYKKREQLKKYRDKIETYYNSHKLEFCKMLANIKDIPELKDLIVAYRDLGGEDF